MQILKGPWKLGLGSRLVVECSRCSAVSVFHWGQ